jgi:hypothetical protein
MWGLRALVAALVIFHLCTLADYPAPFIDEGWFIARARGFAQDGYPFGALDEGVFDRLPGYRYFFPYLPTALQALPFLFFDEPNLLATRAISLSCGLVLVYCVFLIGTWVSGHVTGLLSAALLLSAPFFLLSSHLARIDVEAAAVGIIGFTLILTSARISWIRLVLGGFLAGVAIEFHPHAAVITASALVAALVVGSSMRERALSFMFASFGCGLGGLLYVFLHILPDPGAFLAFQKIAFAPTHTPPLFTFDARVVIDGLYHALLATFGGDLIGPLLCFVIFVGGIALTNGRTRTIGGLAGMALLACGVLLRHKFGFYNIYFQPLTLVFTASLLGFLFAELDSWSGTRRMCGRVLQACVVVMCLRIGVGFTHEITSALHQPTSMEVLPDLSAFVRPDDRVMGNQTFWLAVPNVRYYSPEHLIYYTRWKHGASVSDALRELRPTLIIQDGHLRDCLTTGEQGCWYICFPDDGLDRLVVSSELVATIPNSTYGEIRIYRPRYTS